MSRTAGSTASSSCWSTSSLGVASIAVASASAMKLEPPVPVPVDSILSWGCDDDLLSNKFNSCDVADSTTGSSLDNHNGPLAGSSGLGVVGCSNSAMGQVKNTTSLLSLDGLDGLLLSGATATVLATPTTPGPGPGGGHSFAELKPLPPFEYSTMTSLDGSLNSSAGSQHGHHGHHSGTRTILDINLNLYKATSGSNNNNNNNNNSLFYGEPVSTTTVVNGLVSVGPVKDQSMADYLMNPEIDDIAAIIGNAIADSTVASASVAHPAGVESIGEGVGCPDIRDPWADIDAWIESACSTVYKHEPMLESPASSVTSGTSHSSLSSVSPAFAHPSLPPINTLQSSQQQQTHNSSCSVSSTLQALLTQGGATAGGVALAHMAQDPGGVANNPGHQSMAVKSEPSMDMPLLQRRLTAGRHDSGMGGSSGSSGPMTAGHNFVSCSMAGSSKELQQQLPHTTFHTGPNLNHVTTSLPHLGDNGCHSSSFARRSTAGKNGPGGHFGASGGGKDLSDLEDQLGGVVAPNGGGGSSGKSKHKNRGSSKSKMSTVMTSDGNGKEKPVHRCNICNRGFLNKSNIKVHLRTHTGEKPFKCDACAKAFRQKAHLLKHMQIHKRVSRD